MLRITLDLIFINVSLRAQGSDYCSCIDVCLNDENAFYHLSCYSPLEGKLAPETGLTN